MTPHQRLLLAAASNLAEPGGPVSLNELSRATGIPVTTARETIRRMEATGGWPYRGYTRSEGGSKGGPLSRRKVQAASDAEVPAHIAAVRAEKQRAALESSPAWEPTWEVPVVRVCLPDHSRRPSDAI